MRPIFPRSRSRSGRRRNSATRRPRPLRCSRTNCAPPALRSRPASPACRPPSWRAPGPSDGPVIAILAEMDALPGMSQEAVPDRTPIASQIAGHACGHHLFGTGAVAAAVAIKRWLEILGHQGPDPRLRHAGGRRRRRQGLHGARRAVQGRGCDAVLASRRRQQRLAGQQSRDHQREVPLSWAIRPCGGRARSRPLRARRASRP